MIQRRRQYHYETKTGHERWLVSYADFITLLFAFFVVMYSVSQVSDQKYRVLSETLANLFEGKVPIDAEIKDIIDKYPLDEKGQITGLSPVVKESDTETLASDIADAIVQMVKSGDVSILALDDTVEINMNANALFASGSAEPSSEAKQAFAKVAEQIKPLAYKVEVAGHTDNVPIHTKNFRNNWELSSARATAIVSLLMDGGVKPQDLKATAYGEYQPIADNANAEGRAQNRRVVLTVTKALTGSENGLESKPGATQAAQGDEQSPATLPLGPNGEATTVAPEQAEPKIEESKIDEPDIDDLSPVRLDNGGLLFSSDPELPRK